MVLLAIVSEIVNFFFKSFPSKNELKLEIFEIALYPCFCDDSYVYTFLRPQPVKGIWHNRG